MKEKVNQIKGQYTEAAMAGGVSQSLGSQMNPFMSIRELTVSGLLAGITIFLGLTGYGFIPLIFMNATILHIPTIIGSVVAGPRVGIVVGFLFGAFSFIQTFRAPSLLMQFILQYSVVYDAFICIVPRICIALVSYWLYKHIPVRDFTRTAIAAVCGSLTNTVLFLGSIFILVGAPYAEAHDMSVAGVGYLLMGIVTMNGIPEALVSGIIITPIVMMLKKSGWKMK